MDEITEMRVLMISTTKFELDGITNVILNYYRALDKSNMQIDFVVPNNIRDDLKSEIEFLGSNIYQIVGRAKNPLSYMKKLSTLISNNKYNIVHAHGNSCTLALEMYASKKGGAKVRIPHSHNSTCKHLTIHRLLRKPFDNNYTNAFACGEKAGNWLYDGKPFEVINNGIEINKYKFNMDLRSKYRNKYNLIGKKVIGHVGHFTYQKNHDYLIDVFEKLHHLDNNYRLILIGDGELRSEVEEKVHNLGLSNEVIFTGKTLNVPQLMQAMDMMIMPSRFEGLPLTLVEAQTSGLPCFVSDVVSREVGITNLVDFISLDKEQEEWANYIHNCKMINREETNNVIINDIINAGYSIEDNASRMKELYKLYIAQENG